MKRAPFLHPLLDYLIEKERAFWFSSELDADTAHEDAADARIREQTQEQHHATPTP